MINSESSALMNQIIANSSAGTYSPNAYANPVTKFSIEQYQNQLNQMQPTQQIQPQSNPYDDCIKLLSSCSDLVKQKIVNDKNYQQAENECELLIKQLWYAEIVPRVMQYQQGRIAFEQLLNVTKQLKQNYSQEEVQMTHNMQVLMQDEVVLARLRELQNQQSAVKSTVDEVGVK